MSRLDVYMGSYKAGVLAYYGPGDYRFTYDSNAQEPISLTMPIRAETYHSPSLHPIFQVSLPEGVLRETILRNPLVSKTQERAGTADMALLGAVGGNLVGRISVLPEGSDPPGESGEDTVLPERLFESLMRDGFSERGAIRIIKSLAVNSGISGGYMKVLADVASERHERQTTMLLSRWIVKRPDDRCPAILENELHSMITAERAGISIPEIRLGDKADALLISRFDVRENGERLAFEDMASLLGLESSMKFMGSVESVVKTIATYCDPKEAKESLARFYHQYVMAMTIGNGDAHLKNFALLYSLDKAPTLSPCYDMVSMSAYAPTRQNGDAEDTTAMTLAGTHRFPWQKDLKDLGKRCRLAGAEVDTVINNVGDAVTKGLSDLDEFAKSGDSFAHVAERMAAIWKHGLIRLENPKPIRKKKVGGGMKP